VSTYHAYKREGLRSYRAYNGLSREAYFAIIDEGKRLRIPVEGHVPFAISGWEATAAGQKSFEHLFGIPDACSSQEEELRPKIAAAKRPIQRDRLYAQASLGYSEEKCRYLFAAFKKNQTWQVPTLTIDRSVGWLRDPQFMNDDRLRFFILWSVGCLYTIRSWWVRCFAPKCLCWLELMMPTHIAFPASVCTMSWHYWLILL